jgi:hypothetical protein
MSLIRGATILFIAVMSQACLPAESYHEEPAKSDSHDIPTVTYCDLVGHQDLYNNKRVRIRAVFSYGWEISYLGDVVCDPAKTPMIKDGKRGVIWVDLEPYSGKGDPDGTSKKLQEYGVKDLTAVGTFSTGMPGYGHMGTGRVHFTIEHVERMAWIDKTRY